MKSTFFFFFSGAASMMFYGADALKVLKHNTVSHGEWAIKVVFISPANYQEACNTSLADSTAMGTMAIPIPSSPARPATGRISGEEG